MKARKILGMLALTAAVFFTACGPKDADISQSVSTNLSQAVPGVTASVTDGVVTLNGQVSNEAAKASAETEAKKVNGVKSVVNNITVVLPAPEITFSPDDMLRKGVMDATKDFPTATATVTDGEIIVTGELTSDQWKRLKIALDALQPKRVNAATINIKN